MYSNQDVFNFYAEMPFNFHADSTAAAEHIKKSNIIKDTYTVLSPYIAKKSNVSLIDIGCGAGVIANNIAYHCNIEVLGIDFNPVAIERAREVSSLLGNRNSSFRAADLFDFYPEKPFDIALSLGVLHHTMDCLRALRHVLKNMVRHGGFAFIGLYHKFGREPFIEHFQALKRQQFSEQALYEEYRRLNKSITDEPFLKSWFRDQVLHPHESLHTLEEIILILDECGCRLVSTSINKFRSFSSPEYLIKEEKKYTAISKEKLQEGLYFPGFFIFLPRNCLNRVPTNCKIIIPWRKRCTGGARKGKHVHNSLYYITYYSGCLFLCLYKKEK